MLAVKKIHARFGLKMQPVEAADLFEEGNRLVITAHEKMLAVIDHIARRLIDEGVGAPAEMTAPLKQENACALLAQTDSGGKPCKAPANDDDALARHHFLNLLLSQIRSAICKRRDFGTVSRLR